MTDQLALYLNDHLSGAKFALELLKGLQEVYTNQPLGTLSKHLFIVIDEDRAVLQKLADEVGSGGSSVKEAAAWLAEKVSRLKLRLDSDSDLGTFQALETLSLGVLGKQKLWQALSAINSSDPRIQELDFEALIGRANSQHDDLESYRLQLATTALCEQSRPSA